MATELWQGTTNGNAGTSTNYSPNTVPSSGDDLYAKTTSVAIDAGLDQHTVTLNSLNVSMSMTGAIGTAAAYYQVGATSVRIGDPGGEAKASAGNGRWKFDFGSVQTSIVVVNSASTALDSGLEPVRIIGTHASNKLYVQGGRVGVATTSPLETSVISEFSISSNTAVLNFGNGVTLTTGYQTAGAVTISSAMTTFTQEAGTATVQGAGVIRNLTVGGTVTNTQRPSTLAVSGITRSSTTATATSNGHGYSNGDTIFIAGANEGNYDGYFVISNVATNTFDYAISSTTPTPATGTITCTKAIASLTILDSGTADFSSGSNVYCAAITRYPGGKLLVNSANPGHFHFGTVTLVGTGSLLGAD